LRAVSHDLRSPLTAISAAGEAIGSAALSASEREELAAVIQERHAASRARRQPARPVPPGSGSRERGGNWTSVEELIRAAVRELSGKEEEFALSIDREMALVRLDAAQMERAFVNVLENARRHSGGTPCRCARAPYAAWPIPAAARARRGRRRGAQGAETGRRTA